MNASVIRNHQSEIYNYEGGFMDAEQLKSRTKQFGLRVIRLVESLPKTRTANIIANQLLRSGISVGANYRAACRGRSKPDFASKIGIVVEETDETLYWMEILIESGTIPEERLTALMQEANELMAIFTPSLKTTRETISRKQTK
jgi:four helix bundle protein